MNLPSQLIQLTTAGHYFLLDVLPLRGPESRTALETFVAAAASINPSVIDFDLVVLRCLEVLAAHTVQRIPSLFDQYLQMAADEQDDLKRFFYCVERLLEYEGISDAVVQDVMSFVDANFAMRECTPGFVAANIEQRLETLDVRFRASVGCTLREYIRDVRLQHACGLLATSNKSIKEVWAVVGYAHHSNFDHDFKRQFGCTPTEYRQRVIRPAAQKFYRRHKSEPAQKPPPTRPRPLRLTKLLIIDSDDRTRAMLRRALHDETTDVFDAASGSDGLTAAERLRPDVILLEYFLPDGDGLKFLRQLRAQPDGAAPGVALFSADCRVFDRADEARRLNARVASKLCALDQVRDLVAYLAFTSEPGLMSSPAPDQRAERWRNRWIV